MLLAEAEARLIAQVPHVAQVGVTPVEDMTADRFEVERHVEQLIPVQEKTVVVELPEAGAVLLRELDDRRHQGQAIGIPEVARLAERGLAQTAEDVETDQRSVRFQRLRLELSPQMSGEGRLDRLEPQPGIRILDSLGESIVASLRQKQWVVAGAFRVERVADAPGGIDERIGDGGPDVGRIDLVPREALLALLREIERVKVELALVLLERLEVDEVLEVGRDVAEAGAPGREGAGGQCGEHEVDPILEEPAIGIVVAEVAAPPWALGHGCPAPELEGGGDHGAINMQMRRAPLEELGPLPEDGNEGALLDEGLVGERKHPIDGVRDAHLDQLAKGRWRIAALGRDEEQAHQGASPRGVDRVEVPLAAVQPVADLLVHGAESPRHQRRMGRAPAQREDEALLLHLLVHAGGELGRFFRHHLSDFLFAFLDLHGELPDGVDHRHRPPVCATSSRLTASRMKALSSTTRKCAPSRRCNRNMIRVYSLQATASSRVT